MDTLPSKRGPRLLFIVIQILFGVYFINFPLNFFQIPAGVTKFDSWIIFVGGLFILLGAVNYFRLKRRQF